MEYPSDERQSCGFAIRFIRWLVDSGTVAEIGLDGLAILVGVVTKEDELHYSRPVNFFNSQLQTRCGITSIHTLISARKRAIDAGLLKYEPGAKRRPGRYFVSGFCADGALKANAKANVSQENHLTSKPSTQSKVDRNRKRFQQPTLEEVRTYCNQRGNQIDPRRFIDYYTANGWKVGRTPMIDWKAAVRTWEGREQNRHQSAPNDVYAPLKGNGGFA